MKKEKMQYFIYGLVVVAFIILSIIIGMKHEPWADEAQAWLISRDSSVVDMFSYYMHYDGHPGLWHIILKLFQFIGLPYSNIFIISILFSTLGIIIFEYKSKFPLIIKILFPFTYFIFYQYTIVARGYCLLFPLLCLIASIWDDRFKRPLFFTFLLILLANTEAYTYIFAGMIFLFYVFDLYKNKYNFKKYLPYIIILIISFIIVPFYVFPLHDTTFKTRAILYLISDSFITPYLLHKALKIIISLILVLYILLAYLLKNNTKDFIVLAIFLIPVILFYEFFYYNIWHLGILLLLFMFVLWIQNNTNDKLITVFLILTCIIQCYFTYKSCSYDYSSKYSGAQDAASFISKYNYNDLKIYGLGFNAVAINAYFDNNIYDNWNDDLGFFFWNINGEYYHHSVKELSMIENNVDIIISSDFYFRLNNDLLKDKYNIYQFQGNSFAEDFVYENNSYTVYVSKSIDKQE